MKKIKIILAFMTIFLMLGMLKDEHKANAATASTGFVYGASSYTNVYYSYNTNSKVVVKIPRGEKLKSATLYSKNWYYVNYNNIKGYVPVGEVILDKVPKAYDGVGKLTSSVYSYKSADTRSKQVRTIKNGTSVHITGIVGTWYKINNNGVEEYITNQNIKVDANESVSSYTAKGTVKSTSNVILYPNQYATVLTTLPAGRTVEIVGKSKNFYKIKYNSSYAYILNSRVNIEVTSSYSDNTSKLYYELASLAYEHFDSIKDYKDCNTMYGDKKSICNLNKAIKALKLKNTYEVIDTIDLGLGANNYDTRHPMAKAEQGNIKLLNQSSFQAFTIVDTTNKKLFIAFSGSNDTSKCFTKNADELKKCDLIQVATKTYKDTPAQAYDAHLYVNYIYDQYYNYRNYKWYLTGHSYGGYLATKVFLDAESNEVLNKTNDSNNKIHAGAIRKKIQGVYTFNPVTTQINEFAGDWQLKENNNGRYDKYVHNLIYKDELVNYYQKNTSNKRIYVGETQVVTSPKVESQVLSLILGVRLYNKHKLANLSEFVK